MKRPVKTFLLFSALLALLAVAGLALGSVPLNLLDLNGTDAVIFWSIRMPRVLLAALIGSMLSVSGAILQGVLKNPLCDPYILGLSAGGALAAAAAIITGAPAVVVSVAAFSGALIAVFVVYQVSKVSGRTRPATLILAGVAVSSLLSAFLMLAVLLSGRLQPVYYWILGSLSSAAWPQVWTALACAAAGTAAAMLYARRMNILMLGEDEALSLGVNVQKERGILLMVASFLTGVAVSMCGMIGFVGLVVPHVVRLITGGNNISLVPLSAALGAALLVGADLVARTAVSPTEIPVGIITAMIGAPFFIWLLRRGGS